MYTAENSCAGWQITLEYIQRRDLLQIGAGALHFSAQNMGGKRG
jgi:hypothetical protein